MTRISPLQRDAAIRLLAALLKDPEVDDAATVIATTFHVPRTTVNSWKRQLEAGHDPVKDRRTISRREALSPELLALVAHHKQVKRAHAAAVRAGDYARSYHTFRRAFFEHDQTTRKGVLFGRRELIANQPVMRYPIVERSAVTVMDHTRSDVRCVHPRRNSAERPWVSFLRDKGTGVMLGGFARWGSPDAEWVAAIVAASMQMREVPLVDSADELVTLGGRPGMVLVDNGGENTGDRVVELVAQLGVALATTTPGHPWQNGLAEKTNLSYQQAVEYAAPGYVRAGQDVQGELRYVAARSADQDLDDLISLEELQARMDKWMHDTNRTPGDGGLTPLERWQQAPNTVRPVSNEELRVATLRGAKGHYAYTKNGLRFQGRDYQGPGLTDYIGKGSVLTVRYLPNSSQWIDVYDKDQFLVRAEDVDRLSKSMQSLIIAQRRRATGRVSAAETESLRMRQRDARAALLDAGDVEEFADFPEPPTPHDLGYRSQPRTKGPMSNVEEKAIRDRDRHVDELISALQIGAAAPAPPENQAVATTDGESTT